MSVAAQNQDEKPKRPAHVALAGVVGVALTIAAGAWALQQADAERTDDAYVDGNAVLVTAQVGGTVTSIAADNTDHVQAGAVLVALNPADRDVDLERAQAALAKATRLVRAQFAQVDQGRSELEGRRNDVRKAQADLSRRAQLAASGAVSQEEINHAQEALANAQAAEEAARQALAQRAAMVDSSSLRDHPDVVAAASNLRDAYLAATRTRIVAPVSGTVTRRSVQLGERIGAGAALMTVVPLDALWVNANFKESQRQRIHLGQAVELTSDLYGSGIAYRGRVIGLDAGTGSAFAVLPAQNATGNWIKVTQRVPVRIAIDPAEVDRHPLRLGLSMHVSIRSAQAVATDQPGAPHDLYSTRVFDDELRHADALVDSVIRRNGGAPQAAAARAATRGTM